MTAAAFLILVAAAIFLPVVCGMMGWRYWRVRKEAPNFAKAHQQLKDIRFALREYESQQGRFPPDLELLETLSYSNTPYIVRGATTDPWGHPFAYSLPKSNSPKVRCLGHDGKEGGTGIDCDLEDP